MESIILKPSDLDINKIDFSDPQILSNGAKTIFINYLHDDKKKKIILQLPKLYCPSGLIGFDQGEYMKYSVEFSFLGMEKYQKIKSSYDLLESIDNKIINYGIENCQKWFFKKNMNLQLIKSYYVSQIKYSKDQDNEINDLKYSPNIKLKIPFKDDHFMIDIFDCNKKRIYKNLSNILVKGSKCQSLIELTGIWFAGNKFGCSWKVLQLKIYPNYHLNGYSFVDDSDNDDQDDTNNIYCN